MRVLCVSVADFWLAWARAHDGAPLEGPLVLTVAGRVRACSAEASLAGVQAGLAERVAAVRCPEAHRQELQEEAPRAAWQEMLAALGRFSPLVESPREGLAYLSADGLERHYRDELHLGLAAGQVVRSSLALAGSIGIADGKFTAEAAAARACRGSVLIVPSGAERLFLQHLPVNLLALPEESQRQLGLLGVQTLEQYAALPHDAVQSRFGRPGHEAWGQAQGSDKRPLLPHQEERCLQASAYFDDPLWERSALERAVKRLLAPLCRALEGEGLACQELQLALEPERGPAREESYTLREPAATLGHLQPLVVELLARSPCALRALTLRLRRLVCPEAGQLGLFMDRQMATEIDSTLAALAARYGDDCFQRARAANPDSPLPEERYVFEPFRMAS